MNWHLPFISCTIGAILTCPLIPWPWVGLIYGG